MERLSIISISIVVEERLILYHCDVCRCGIQEMYLSAMDSVPEFYAKLGYAPCEPVSIYGGPVSSPCPSPGPPTPLYIVYKHKRVLKTFMKKPLYDVEL